MGFLYLSRQSQKQPCWLGWACNKGRGVPWHCHLRHSCRIQNVCHMTRSPGNAFLCEGYECSTGWAEPCGLQHARFWPWTLSRDDMGKEYSQLEYFLKTVYKMLTSKVFILKMCKCVTPRCWVPSESCHRPAECFHHVRMHPCGPRALLKCWDFRCARACLAVSVYSRNCVNLLSLMSPRLVHVLCQKVDYKFICMYVYTNFTASVCSSWWALSGNSV